MKNAFMALICMLLMLSCTGITQESRGPERNIHPKQKTEKAMRILLILTSHDDLGEMGKKTGFWLSEFTDPYYYLVDRAVDVTLASPKGGQPPIDPKSELPDFQTEFTKRFEQDKTAQEILSKTVKLETVNQMDFDAVFFSGGYGPMWDLADSKSSISLIESFYNNNKPIASVCHAPAIFKKTKDAEGNSLIQGKKVTAYSNSEEEAVDFTEIVPFSVEDMLKGNGGIYSKGPDWGAYALEDGLIITGQNPASAELVAEMLLKKLN